ncbi:hypothetical protein SUGI_1166600 [Cryptomeria japonica]|nr:hypothetical protein SUGI_1166600 [Cryptomeria japonica]
MSLSTGMQSVASTEQQVTSSVTEITTSPTACIVSFATSPVLTHSLAQMITPISTPACTSILGTVGTSMSLPLVNPIPVITATPTLSTIVTTSKDKEVSIEVIQKTPLKLLLTGKAIEDDIDLDKEIVIPQIDLNTASIDEMRLISQLLEQKAKQKQLRSERDREFNIINDAKTILTDALGIKVDPSQHILLQLEEAVNRFNEDSSGEEKLIERTEKKFDNKVLEHIAQQIAIKQVELTTILAKLENSFNNVTSFFAKLCDVTEFTKGIRDQLKKIDDDLKASAQQLQLDPSSSSTHHSNIRFLLNKQSELLREDARIRLYRAFSKAHRLNSSNRAVRLSPRSQFSPSHQWLPSDTISTESPQLPSSKLHFRTSMDRASTLTKNMTMLSTVVDAVYQKITEPA